MIYFRSLQREKQGYEIQGFFINFLVIIKKVQNLILQFIEEHGQYITLFEEYSKEALEKGLMGKYLKCPRKLQ